MGSTDTFTVIPSCHTVLSHAGNLGEVCAQATIYMNKDKDNSRMLRMQLKSIQLSFFWIPHKKISFIMEMFLALILQPWESQNLPTPFCLAKTWCTEMATALSLAYHHKWITWVNLPLGLGSCPAPPGAWLTSLICWLLSFFSWHVFCSARLPFTDWKDGCSLLWPVQARNC